MLTIERQCELLGIPRSTYYYKPKPKGPAVDERREAAMRAIDDIHLEMPFAGARKMSFPTAWLTSLSVDLPTCWPITSPLSSVPKYRVPRPCLFRMEPMDCMPDYYDVNRHSFR